MGRRGRAYRQQGTGRRLALIAGYIAGMGHAKGGGATSCLPLHLHRSDASENPEAIRTDQVGQCYYIAACLERRLTIGPLIVSEDDGRPSERKVGKQEVESWPEVRCSEDCGDSLRASRRWTP